jgi:transcriptional regulator with XRE-family HTH domain
MDTGPGQAELLDSALLGQMLRKRRGSLSLRQAAADAGVSFSTFSRVEAGSHPDLASFARLCAWLGVSPGEFFSPVAERAPEPIDAAISHLYADPRLDEDKAEKIASLLRDLYSALAKPVPEPAVVTCYLRAAPVLRPGVPKRLGLLLADIEEELGRRVDAGQL